MNKKMLTCLMIIMFVFLTSCGTRSDVTSTQPDDSEKSTQASEYAEENDRKPDFYENINIVIDKEAGMATYKDDAISYAWNVENYRYEFYNSRPSLPITIDDITYRFIVFDVNNGIPSDLDSYVINCGRNYFNTDVSGYVCADHPYGINEKGYMYSECTIHYANKEANTSSTEILRMFALTNGKITATIGVTVEGTHENLEKLFDENYAGNKDNGLIEKEVKAIMDSFEFVENSK